MDLDGLDKVGGEVALLAVALASAEVPAVSLAGHVQDVTFLNCKLRVVLRVIIIKRAVIRVDLQRDIQERSERARATEREPQWHCLLTAQQPRRQ